MNHYMAHAHTGNEHVNQDFSIDSKSIQGRYDFKDN